MKEHTLRRGLMIAVLACLLLLPVGWAQQPKPGGTLRVAWEADISGLDPHLSFGMQARHVVGNLFNSLVTIDAELNFVPDLAESWEILENSKVYVFHLRKGVKFHDGTDFDPAAVRWNYQRVVNPEEKTLDAAYYNIVEAVEVLDRPIFLRRITRDRDWDQIVVNVAATIDPHTISQGIDTRAGNNTFNHEDTHVDALIDRMREASTEEAFLQAGYDFQRYVVENMITTSVSSYGHLQAARSYVKGYENLHGYKLRFETTWLDK
jgi:ABC-type transport system substrate-binding protein